MVVVILAWLEAVVAAILVCNFYREQERVRFILNEEASLPYLIAAVIAGHATSVIGVSFLPALAIGVVWHGVLVTASLGPVFRPARQRGQEDMSEFEKLYAPERIGVDGYAQFFLLFGLCGMIAHFFMWGFFSGAGTEVHVLGLIVGALVIVGRLVPAGNRMLRRAVNFFAW